jgi:hypothetical protein
MASMLPDTLEQLECFVLTLFACLKDLKLPDVDKRKAEEDLSIIRQQLASRRLESTSLKGSLGSLEKILGRVAGSALAPQTLSQIPVLTALLSQK